ncbi:CHRD domain-containing protein [Methylonatrum kenyense]|uniref:CHRD domain-containing protein n=1 Tax=Methylonatrum kenyense TaxID=455253 RepID=UPI0020C0ECCD|nr:CHRD domain-containing protein [Methylonatrum kenyense]MCK8514787.1 CHRD domain-containing protein [Methylonatrum kenyense]
MTVSYYFNNAIGGKTLMRRHGFRLALLLITLAPGMANTATDPKTYHAVLLGANVASAPADTAASAQVTALLHDRTLSVHGSFQGLSSPLRDMTDSPDNPGILLQEGGHGEAGTPLYGLAAETGPESESGIFHGRFRLSLTEAQQLRDGELHLKIVSRDFPDGELRGQLIPLESDTQGRVLRGQGEQLSAD